MLMILFGAGASHDSSSRPSLGLTKTDNSSINRCRPPLARELFAEDYYGDQIRAHQGCAALFPILREAASIEEQLEALSEEAKELPHIARQLFELRYYLQDVVRTCTSDWFTAHTRGATNQAQLLSEVEGWRLRKTETVCLVTFNYDTLLEEGFRSASLPVKFRDMSSYIADPHYKLFKLHGSIDWSRVVANVQGSAADCVEQLQWTSEYIMGQPPTSYPGKAYVPAIAVPTVSKSAFECPPDHLVELSFMFPNVRRLLTIGWRGMEKHFLNLWQQPGPKDLERICIVTGTEAGAKAVEQNLLYAGITAQEVRLHAEGFSGFLRHGMLKAFLYDDPGARLL